MVNLIIIAVSLGGEWGCVVRQGNRGVDGYCGVATRILERF